MPDEFSLEEIIERLIILEKIEKGLAQAKAGQVLSSEEVKKRLEKWLK
jgi:predicted transcriptional regulator